MSIWKAWNMVKKELTLSDKEKWTLGLHDKESIWWPFIKFPHVSSQLEFIALKLHLKGIRCWGNVWDHSATPKQSYKAKLLPIPPLPNAPIFHYVLNKRWCLLWDRRRWYDILGSLWNSFLELKKACFAWLVTYRGFRTSVRSLKWKIGDGRCAMCHQQEDDLHL